MTPQPPTELKEKFNDFKRRYPNNSMNLNQFQQLEEYFTIELKSLINSPQVRKKGNSDGSNENYLETQSIAGEYNKEEQMPVGADNQHSADSSEPVEDGSTGTHRGVASSGSSNSICKNCGKTKDEHHFGWRLKCYTFGEEKFTPQKAEDGGR